jgi:hypothetical protein
LGPSKRITNTDYQLKISQEPAKHAREANKIISHNFFEFVKICAKLRLAIFTNICKPHLQVSLKMFALQKMAFFTQNLAKLCKNLIIFWFLRTTPIFSPKIAKNRRTL